MAFVETWMTFAGDIKGRARVDVPDWSRTNLVLDKHDVRISDGRPERESLCFDREGFRLLDHPSPIDADCDLKAEAAGYLKSVGTLPPASASRRGSSPSGSSFSRQRTGRLRSGSSSPGTGGTSGARASNSFNVWSDWPDDLRLKNSAAVSTAPTFCATADAIH